MCCHAGVVKGFGQFRAATAAPLRRPDTRRDVRRYGNISYAALTSSPQGRSARSSGSAAASSSNPARAGESTSRARSARSARTAPAASTAIPSMPSRRGCDAPTTDIGSRSVATTVPHVVVDHPLLVGVPRRLVHVLLPVGVLQERQGGIDHQAELGLVVALRTWIIAAVLSPDDACAATPPLARADMKSRTVCW